MDLWQVYSDAVPRWGWAVALAVVVLLGLLLLVAKRRRRSIWIILGSALVVGALFAAGATLVVPEFEEYIGEALLLGLLGLVAVAAVWWAVGLPQLSARLLTAVAVVLFFPVSLLVLWRRTRRLGIVVCGLAVFGVSMVWLFGYFSAAVCDIGFTLLLIGIWPCWRLVFGAPRGPQAPRVAARGVLEVRPWPACRREESGVTLVSVLVGVMCLVIAFAFSVGMLSQTMRAIRHADHLATATDLLEGMRERSLLGLGNGDAPARAARLLPHGEATMQRQPESAGLARVTAVATWREPTGRRGEVTLEWLASERSP